MEDIVAVESRVGRFMVVRGGGGRIGGKEDERGRAWLYETTLFPEPTLFIIEQMLPEYSRNYIR